MQIRTGLRWTHEKKAGAFSQFWVDGADLSGFTPAQVFRLLTADRDVVGGAYPIKHYDWPRVARDLREGVPEAPAYM